MTYICRYWVELLTGITMCFVPGPVAEPSSMVNTMGRVTWDIRVGSFLLRGGAGEQTG